MGIFKRRIKNEIESQSTNQTYTIQQINEFFDNSEILSAVGKSNLTAATYYACMLIRCNAIAKIPFKIYIQDGDGAKVYSHSLSELLRFRPNIFTSAHDFVWATEFQRLECGNAYWVYNFSGGKITALYLLDSTSVEVMIDNTGLLDKPNSVYYIYHDSKKGELIYPADNIVHFKNFSMNSIKGTSIKKYLYSVISQEKYAQEVVNEKYSKGLQDPIVVTYTGDLSQSRSQAIKKKFASLGGAKNAGQVVPIPTEFDVKMLETKLVNSQFFQLNGLTTRHIANAFGVKSFQLNDMEKSTYNNIEQQNRAFYSDTLQNALTAYEQEMTYKLLSSHDRTKGVYIKGNVDVLLRADTESRYRAYGEGIRNGFIQVAEVRKKEDMPFVPGTDRLIFGNGAAVPFDEIGIQYSEKGGDSNE